MLQKIMHYNHVPYVQATNCLT